MVNESGQLYTIEGFAAALLLVFTIYLILSATNILTPGDTHITDMQLEQLGNDALAMMDTPTQYVETGNAYTAKQSDLEKYIMSPTNANLAEFNSTLSDYLNVKNISRDSLHYNAIVWYRNDVTGSIGSYQFSRSLPAITGREHFVRVTRLVTLSGLPIVPPPDPIFSNPPPAIPPNPPNPTMDNRPQTVLLDVTLWRD